MIVRTLAASLLLATTAQAQPAQIGNTYGGTHHQPTADVRPRERAAGVAPSPAQAQEENTDLSHMNAELQDKARTDAQQDPATPGKGVGTQPSGVVQTNP